MDERGQKLVGNLKGVLGPQGLSMSRFGGPKGAHAHQFQFPRRTVQRPECGSRVAIRVRGKVASCISSLPDRVLRGGAVLVFARESVAGFKIEHKKGSFILYVE